MSHWATYLVAKFVGSYHRRNGQLRSSNTLQDVACLQCRHDTSVNVAVTTEHSASGAVDKLGRIDVFRRFLLSTFISKYKPVFIS